LNVPSPVFIRLSKSKSLPNIPGSVVGSVEPYDSAPESVERDGIDVGACDDAPWSFCCPGVGLDVPAPGGDGVRPWDTELGAECSGGTGTRALLGDGWTDFGVADKSSSFCLGVLPAFAAGLGVDDRAFAVVAGLWGGSIDPPSPPPDLL